MAENADPWLESLEQPTDYEEALRNALLRRLVDERAVDGELDVESFVSFFPGHEEFLTAELSAFTPAEGSASREPAVLGSAVPETIGRYEVVRQIGAGGMGVVYEARDQRLQRTVVVKTLKARLGDRAAALRRLRREAEITARLDHDGICPTLDLVEEDEALHVVMRRIPGRSLLDVERSARAHLESGRETEAVAALWHAIADTQSDSAATLGNGAASSQNETPISSAKLVLPGHVDGVLGLFERLARAAHAAHEAGVVHRDLKPGNVMVRPDGRPVILDFGLAVDLEDEGPRESVEGMVLGTPAYMAPEQVEGRLQELDRLVDVYALGVILYEMLTGRRPFRGDGSQIVMRQILTQVPEAPRQLNPSISRDLDAVCLKAMSKARSERYASALELADEIARVRTGVPTVARPATFFDRGLRGVRRNPWIAAAGLAAAGLLLSLGVWSATADREAQQNRRAGVDATFDVVEALVTWQGDPTPENEARLRELLGPDVDLGSLRRDGRPRRDLRMIRESVLAKVTNRGAGFLVGPEGVLTDLSPSFTVKVPDDVEPDTRFEVVVSDADWNDLPGLVAEGRAREANAEGLLSLGLPEGRSLPVPPGDRRGFRWRLRVFDGDGVEQKMPGGDALAFEVVHPDVVERIRGGLPARLPEPFVRVETARRLMEKGLTAAALREVEGVREGEVPRALRREVRILKADALVELGRRGEALRLVEAIEAESGSKDP